MFRKAQGNTETIRFRNTGAAAAVVFLHGFSGHASKTWGEFPQFICEEPHLRGWDVFGLGYPSTLRVDVPGIWTADPGIDVLAQELSTAVALPPLSGYRSLALVAHSMGGLVAQRALLYADTEKRVSHLFLFGTPSAGLTKATLGGLLKPQLRDMGSGGAFITDLRAEWARHYGEHVPFELWVVAGDRDQFVPTRSSLAPFPDAVQAVIPGDHLSIVKPTAAQHRGVQFVIERLRGTGRARHLVDSALIAIERKEFQKAIKVLLPRVDELDAAALVQLALALDGVGRGEEALRLLEQRLNGGASTTDAMGTLAGRVKRRWLVERSDADLRRARELYSTALDLAEASGDADQAMYHAINVSFLDTIASPESSAVPESAKTFANRALRHAAAATAGAWREATIGEARLILGELDRATEAYRSALAAAPGAREIDSMYAQAVRAAGRVFRQKGIDAIEVVFDLPSPP